MGVFLAFLPHFSASLSNNPCSKLSFESNHNSSNRSKYSLHEKFLRVHWIKFVVLISALRIFKSLKSVNTTHVQSLNQEYFIACSIYFLFSIFSLRPFASKKNFGMPLTRKL